MTTMQRILATVMSVALCGAAAGADAVWTNRTTVGTQNWDAPYNWSPSGVPNGVGQSAVLTQDLTTVGQTIGIYSNATTTLGRLVWGDGVSTTGNYGYTIRGGTVDRVMRFENTGGAPAVMEIYAGGGTPTHLFDMTAYLASDLIVTNAGAQNFTWGRVLDMTNRTLRIAGTGLGNMSFNVDFFGNGQIAKASAGTVNINTTVKSYAGDLTIDSGSLTAVSGSLRNARNLTITGMITNGTFAAGGSATVGSNSQYALNPGQRLPTGVLELSGGRLNLDGQGSLGAWSDVVRDAVRIVRFSAGYSVVAFAVRTGSGGTELNAAFLDRKRGAAAFVRGPSVLGVTGKLTSTNAVSWLAGAGGASNTTTMSIIPWIGGRTVNADGYNPEGFVTYETATGVRPLLAAEHQTLINSAVAGENVRSSVDFTMTASRTINSLMQTGYGTSTIGAGNTLTITSGALYLKQAGTRIGRYGQASAGTLNFGTAEGIVYVASDTGPYASIAASITGSGGLTKTTTGKLTLAGANTYSGTTSVGAGTLQVGGNVYDGSAVLLDANTTSNLGSGDVDVHAGATLRVACANAIADTATVTLRRTGLFRGTLEVDAGQTETVKYLYLGDVAQTAGRYGSSTSGADIKDDTHFAGSGVLVVKSTAGASPAQTMILVR